MTTTDDLLFAEPSIRTGTLVGYGRVSTKDQKLERQIDALTAAGCIRVFTDKKSGKNTDRPELAACLDYLRPGDTLVVLSLDRLARSLADLITIVGDLRRRGVGFRSLHEALDTTTPSGRLIFHVFAALAEFIRELTVKGTNEGLAAARARGQWLGRRGDAVARLRVRHHPAVSCDALNEVCELLIIPSALTLRCCGRGLTVCHRSWGQCSCSFLYSRCRCR